MGTSAYSRLALIGALAAALALGACGRKGNLEAPPSANALAAPQQPQAPSLGEGDPQGFDNPAVQDLPTPRPNQKSFVLDPLLSDSTPPRSRPPQAPAR